MTWQYSRNKLTHTKEKERTWFLRG